MSKSGTAVEVRVHKERLHRIITHGSGKARFHECGSCGEVVIVTADIDGTVYGALNALCMKNRMGFPASVSMDFSGQPAGQKRDRWRQNWCHPVTMTSPGGETLGVAPHETPGRGEYR